MSFEYDHCDEALPVYSLHPAPEDTPPALLCAGLLAGRPLALDPSSMQLIAETELSTKVRSVRLGAGWEEVSWRGGERGFVCLKAVEDSEDGRRRKPRNLRREVAALDGLDHPNILKLLNSYLVPPRPPQDWTFVIHTPLYPTSLAKILQNPLSSLAEAPYNISSPSTPSTPPFTHVINSLTHQLLSAVAYLHRCQVAHRDLNPSNIVVSRQGRLVLIDFGLACNADAVDNKSGKRESQVGTGPYRAPELLFGSTTYSLLEIDLWAVGCILAESFRVFVMEPTPPPTPALPTGPNPSRASAAAPGSYHLTSNDPPVDPSPRDRLFGVAPDPAPQPSGRVHALDSDDSDADSNGPGDTPATGRTPLFDAGTGSQVDLVLIGKVFKIIGTPSLETWPEAASLPNFGRFGFVQFNPQPLAQHCPALINFPTIQRIIEGMLVCSASKRMKASDALRIFETSEEAGVLKVTGEEADWDGGSFGHATLDGKSLAEWLAPFLA